MADKVRLSRVKIVDFTLVSLVWLFGNVVERGPAAAIEGIITAAIPGGDLIDLGQIGHEVLGIGGRFGSGDAFLSNPAPVESACFRSGEIEGNYIPSRVLSSGLIVGRQLPRRFV
jgi:hypothetical protein